MEIKLFKTRKLIFLVILSMSTVSGSAQEVLTDYIDQGLKSNITLQQKKNSYNQAKQSLEIARSFFLPSVNLLADYTSGQGGRSISIPIGDLMNPVYTTLNQLTESENFSHVENVSQNFFPNNFYDARVRASVPIVNSDLIVSRSIHQQKALLKEYEVAAYRRDLVLNIKSAYYNYCSALEAVKIFESAVRLVNKNVAINESLVKNGKSLPANYLRSRSESEKVKADLNSASQQVKNARKYFNFLLNRDLDEEIVVGELVEYSTTGALADEAMIDQREELSMLKTIEGISKSSQQLYSLSRLPKVNAFIDLGSQASDWQFNNDSRYYLLGVQLSVPLFQGFRNNIQIHQARLDVSNARLELEKSKSQLKISAEIASNNLETSHANLLAAREQFTAAKSYYNLIDKGYQQGVNSLLEFIDARNQLTSSELQLTIRNYEVLTAVAKVERETSSYNFSNH